MLNISEKSFNRYKNSNKAFPIFLKINRDNEFGENLTDLGKILN
ncbi:hypothetical protein [Clostridium aciditolerans]|nr:hypothetical protein [Clostridium aciditolerans]